MKETPIQFDVRVHKVFKQAAVKKGQLLKDAAEEALRDWIFKNAPELANQLPEKKTAEIAA